MDASGKPQISRELLQRMTQSRSAPGSGRRSGAYGYTRNQQANRRCNTDRKRIGTYTSSNIANSALNPYRQSDDPAANPENAEATDTTMYGQNRQPGGSRLASLGGGTAAGQSRQEFNSSPKTTFKEPPARNYNPFG